MTTAEPRLYVAYARVSTARQGRSGLGLEAQEQAIQAFIRHGGRLLAPTFIEIESGRNAERPELAKAVARCRATGATLLIAKLDRLSRDAHFLFGLEKSGVEFVAADMRDANQLTVHIMAVVAEQEAKMISARTKAALAAAKERGTRLGGIRPGQRVLTAEDSKRGAKAGSEARKMKANHKAHRVAPRIAELQAEGATLASIATALAAEGIPTPRGGTGWTATAVRRVMLRVGAASVEG
jgi:DNA invertase Pin-like site-specific DNA recombinase